MTLSQTQIGKEVTGGEDLTERFELAEIETSRNKRSIVNT
jgi:hypothetical protein